MEAQCLFRIILLGITLRGKKIRIFFFLQKVVNSKTEEVLIRLFTYHRVWKPCSVFLLNSVQIL